MEDSEEVLLQIIERLERQIADHHFALGCLTSDVRRIKEKYQTYWSSLSADAVPRPDMIREFDNDMSKIIDGTLNDR